MEIKSKLSFVIMVLIISFSFLIPLEIGTVYATSNEEFQNMCEGTFGDVSSSWVLSAVTGCLPGILKKTNELNQVKCKQIVCTYDAVKAGIDPSFCSKEYEYQMCKIGMGEIFAVGGGFLEKFRSMIAQVLENPLGVLWGVATTFSRSYVNGACFSGSPTFLCTFLHIDKNPNGVALRANAIYLVAVDSLALAQTIKQMLDQGFSYFNGAPSYCERVPEIRTEMQKILQYA